MSEPQAMEYNWGGDGSDLHEPVRAHVEAALVPSDDPYPPPLDELLRLGNPQTEADIPQRIAALGLIQAHVPDLLRMARDRALNTAQSDSDEIWAPAHALTALEQLDISAVVPELISLFDVDDEWSREQLVDLLSAAGPGALEPLGRYIQDHTRWVYGRLAAIEALGDLVDLHPDLRDQALAILSDAMERAADNAPDVNGFLLGQLLDLDAVEALPVIQRAFEADAVDETIAGDWGEVLAALGQMPDLNDPLVERSRVRREARHGSMFGLDRPEAPLPQAAAAPAKPRKSATASKKNKRKMSKASRKANKKRRK
ncbi:MAG: hypothetical protein ACJ8CR_19445 [Roseiflexaceae bacterium]